MRNIDRLWCGMLLAVPVAGAQTDSTEIVVSRGSPRADRFKIVKTEARARGILQGQKETRITLRLQG